MKFYAMMLLLLIPWLFLFVGAIRRVRLRNRRLRRFQVEGAGLMVLSVLMKWLVFEPHLQFRSWLPVDWPAYFNHGDAGLFIIGLLMFGMGYFLERRPGRVQSWPQPGKTICTLGLLAGTTLAVLSWWLVKAPWEGEEAWSLVRVWFSLGFVPYSVGYNLWSLDDAVPDDEDL